MTGKYSIRTGDIFERCACSQMKVGVLGGAAMGGAVGVGRSEPWFHNMTPVLELVPPCAAAALLLHFSTARS